MENRDRAVVPPEVVERRARAAEEHRARLLSLARSRTGSREDAEDVVAEAMLRALEFEGLNEDLLPNFLTSVTVRLCADLHARRSVALRHQHRLLPPRDEPGPEDAVCDRSEAEWVAGVVATLPARQRAVLQARAGGESCEAIARRYRMSYKAVESTLSRARAAIRTAFAGTLALPVLVRNRRVIGVTTVAAASVTGVALVAVPYLTPPAADAPRPDPPGVVRLFDVPRPTQEPAPSPQPAPDPSPTGTPAAGEQPEPEAPPKPGDATRTVEAGPVKVEEWSDGYTTAERIEHCLAYGVDPDDRMLCPYPSSTR